MPTGVGEGKAASSISFEQKALNKKNIYIEVTAEAIAI